MLTHTHDLGDNLNLRPIDTKDFRQFLEVDGCRFTYTEDRVTQPRHAQIPELFVEERFAELSSASSMIAGRRLSDRSSISMTNNSNVREPFYTNG
jgi:hypothetical protein